MTTNITLKKENMRIFGKECAAGGFIHKQNPLSLHHICPKCEGGPSILPNCVNVCMLEHSGIHILENQQQLLKIIRAYLLCYKSKPDLLARMQFHIWLEDELEKVGVEPFLTRDKHLIYKRA